MTATKLDLPAPLTPPGCDLRDFPRLMIDVPRLFASTFNATASRNPLAWMIGHKLWYRSWHQVPAGSLPNDDDELCHLAELGFDIKSFTKAKALAMRGWVLCDDGRLYHPIVCEAALEAWQEKLRQRISSGTGNGKRWNIAFDATPIAVDLERLVCCLEVLNPQSKTLLKARRSIAQIAGSIAPTDIPPGPANDPTGTDEASHRDEKTTETTSLGTGTGTGTGTGNIKEEVPRKRGSRLPDDWNPTPELVAYGVGLGLSEAKIASASERFKLYWRASSGRNATKQDWGSAFQFWLRDDADKQPAKTERPRNIGPRVF